LNSKPKSSSPPILSIIGNSGSGKTTLLVKLIPRLKQRGLKVGTIKHDVHGFEIDKPGKDSWRHKQAGAVTTVISSYSKIGIVKDADHDHSLEELLPFFLGTDIVLTEGYKRGSQPKIEVFRPEVCKEPVSQGDEDLIAVISNVHLGFDVPRFHLNDLEGLVEFLITHFTL
jgi:molybdopterin-guanine dinucleotide biosynthesis protein B